MNPFLKKLNLTAHITSSVGWIGSVAAFLVLTIAGLTSRDPLIVQSSYIAMNQIAWFIIVPFAFSALLTGVVQSLGTHWGLFRHYWIIMKLFLTILSTIVLLTKMELIETVATAAFGKTLLNSDIYQLRIELLVHAVGGLLVLLGATVLSVYKPWGRTSYGLRKQNESKKKIQLQTFIITEPWKKYLLLVIGGLVLLFIIMHLFSSSIKH